MDGRLRDTVSPLLGNFFLLFLQSHPLENLKIKLLPNFSHPSAASFPRTLTGWRKNRSSGFSPHRTAGTVSVQATSGAEHPWQKSQACGTALTAAIRDLPRGQEHKHIAEHMKSQAGKPVWLHLMAAWFGALDIHKRDFVFFLAVLPPQKHCLFFLLSCR